MLLSAIPKLPFIDKKQTKEFYLEGLGFQLLSDYDDYFLVRKDQAELHFFSYPEIKPEKSDFMIYLRMDQGIEQLFKDCQSMTPAPRKVYPIDAKPWRQIEFSLIDPNGTLLTFGQAVK